MKKKWIIKVPFKIVIIIIIVMITFFSIVISIGNRVTKNYIKATFETEIPLSHITLNREYGYLRSAIFYKKNHYISTSANLIGENIFDRNIWQSNGPIIDFDTIPYVYSLDDLKAPYRLFKKANNDTINVIKGQYIIKFLLTKD
ncbi:MAG TPA: hypothetical protein PKV73_19570 [Agriterribacter sp.]|nr:hypothetical protein [Chitinophagaceae bacterium]HRP34110.1 hypothetical protein [Agriterribacter sp.]